MADDEFLSDDDYVPVPLKEVARHELHPIGTAARIRELEAVVRFCRDIAEEEWPFQQNNSGAECALRHIISRTNRAVSSGVKGSAPSAPTAANRGGEPS